MRPVERYVILVDIVCHVRLWLVAWEVEVVMGVQQLHVVWKVFVGKDWEHLRGGFPVEPLILSKVSLPLLSQLLLSLRRVRQEDQGCWIVG